METGTAYHGGGTAAGSDLSVSHAFGDLARVLVALALVLLTAWGIGLATRVIRPRSVQAAVVVTSHGEVLPSGGTCDEDSARFDVDNLPCQVHRGPR